MELKRAVTAVAAAFAAGAQAVWMTYPSHRLERSIISKPLMTQANSSPDQFAGRTTLASGSATVTVSTRQVTSDAIINLGIETALPAAYTTRGQTSIVSGAASATASTTAIFSGQAVTLAVENLTSQASGYGRGMRINSIVDGVSMLFHTIDSIALIGTAVVHWTIPQAKHEGIKVNTISPGNFFTLGWADGAARPRDATVMWELRKTT